MSEFDRVIKDAHHIQVEHDLCDSCLGRLFVKRLSLSSNRILGKRLQKSHRLPGRCYICKDLADNLDGIYSQILAKSQEYQFDSFLVGTILKQSVAERDDLIRSKYKLRGIDSIKSDISGQLTKRLARNTKAIPDHLRPDLTITADLRDGSIDLHSRPVVLAGRYTKSSRGLPQRQAACQNCKGRGCAACSFHGVSGFDSIEGKISQFLYKKFLTVRVRITWIGGEDKTSLVRGDGRPFFVRISSPKKRRVRLSKYDLGDGVRIKCLGQIPSIPSPPPRFRSQISLSVRTDSPIPRMLDKITRPLIDSGLVVYDGARRIEKSVYSIKCSKTSPLAFRVLLELDGGVPVREFVDGETVFPNLSDLLQTKCTCESFDFRRVMLQ